MKSILIVDDEDGYRDWLKFELTFSGYDVRTAKGGLEVFQDPENANVDLVISDVRMFPMSGLDVFHALRAMRPRLPFIFISGYPGEDAMEVDLRDVADGYLKKPFSYKELTPLIDRVFNKPAPPSGAS